MFSWVTSKILTVLLIVALTLIVVLGGWLVWTNHTLSAKEKELVEATAQISLLERANKDLELTIALKEKSNQILVSRLRDQTKSANELNERIKEIENAPSTDDGEVYNVLCRAITGFNCVRNEDKNAD